MKAERRHELRESELAHALSVGRDYVRDHGARIGLIVIAAAALIVVVSFTIRSRGAAIDDAWREKDELVYDDAATATESLKRLRALTEETEDELFVLSGLLELGAEALRMAQEAESPPDRELNDVARGAFEGLLEGFPENPLAVGVARCGLASVEENAFLWDKDVSRKEAARGMLRAVIDDPASLPPLVRIARDRIETLDMTFTAFEFAAPEVAPEPVSPKPITIQSLDKALEQAQVVPRIPTKAKMPPDEIGEPESESADPDSE